MTNTITLETPTSDLRDSIFQVHYTHWSNTFRNLQTDADFNAKAYANRNTNNFIDKYPTVGNAVDALIEQRCGINGGLYGNENIEFVSNLVRENSDLIKPITAQSNLYELARAYRGQPKSENEDRADARVRKRLSYIRDLLPDGVLKNVKGQPYADIGAIVADGENGKKMLKGALGLGKMGGDLLFDFAKQAVNKDLGRIESQPLPGF